MELRHPARAARRDGFDGGLHWHQGSHTGNSIGNFNDAQPSTNTNTQIRRPYQQFYDPATPDLGVQALGNVCFIDNFGNSFYHALQVKLDKRYARGLAVGLAYMYSKARNNPRSNRKC